MPRPRRVSRLPSLAVAIGALLALPRAARAAPPTQLPLRDGSVLTGEVVGVELGVRARVRLDDGSVREVAWPELRAVPPPLARQPAAAPTSVVQLESTGATLAISAPGAGVLCTTPCALRMPVGRSLVYVGGYLRAGATVALDVGPHPARYLLYSSPRRNPAAVTVFVPYLLAFDLVLTGVTVGGAVCLAECASADLRGLFGAGGLALGIAGLALTGSATALVLSQFVPSRVGVAAVAPLGVVVAPTAGGALLSVAGRF